ncbi:hypothetical protein BD779DRAFT_1589158 [Infundibulicybe gibba]|nr:hypothetical protein BD779DRAFT_1589158 [Infundibulicybe gibba]
MKSLYHELLLVHTNTPGARMHLYQQDSPIANARRPRMNHNDDIKTAPMSITLVQSRMPWILLITRKRVDSEARVRKRASHPNLVHSSAKMGLLQDILSFFNFKSLGSTQPTRAMFAFPRQGYPAPIKIWKRLLEDTVADNKVLVSEMEATRVERLELWKRKKSPYSEFLLAYVANPRIPGLTACVLIYRTVPSRTPATGPGSTSGGTTSADSQSAEWEDPIFDSCERIAAPTGNTIRGYKCQLLKVSTFHYTARPTIIDLVGTAETLTRLQEDHLLKNTCFWYAGALLICMERSVAVAPVISIKDPIQLNQLTSELMEEARLKQGYEKWISVFNPETADISALREPIAECVAEIREWLRKSEETRIGRENPELRRAREEVREMREARERAEERVRELKKHLAEMERRLGSMAPPSTSNA